MRSLLMVTASLVLASCNSNDRFRELEAENARLRAQLAPQVPQQAGESKRMEQGTKPSGTMSRDEFKREVLGKKTGEVIEAVGQPDQDQDWGSWQNWYYEGRIIDSTSLAPPNTAQLVIKNGRVTDVSFY